MSVSLAELLEGESLGILHPAKGHLDPDRGAARRAVSREIPIQNLAARGDIMLRFGKLHAGIGFLKLRHNVFMAHARFQQLGGEVPDSSFCLTSTRFLVKAEALRSGCR
ncbi:MAG: hypothetical protein INF13_00745 [Methylobacterium sp.]|nr:hypothetical protein [Methylobacterium sp.]